MTEDIAIEVKNVCKDFSLAFKRDYLVRNLIERPKRIDDGRQILHALKDINFSVEKGGCYAILGPNGSGKTTLLKVIAGIYKPTMGNIKVNGNITAFLQLGLGFQDDLTGLENIYLYAAFLDMDRQETYRKLGKIIDFSELDDFINMKMRYFSTGMRSRLAFSVIMQVYTDIILLDEFLAVGDIYFQKKCLAALENFKKEGKTMLIVCQSLESISGLCQRALLLDKGMQVTEGDAGMVIERYKSLHSS